MAKRSVAYPFVEIAYALEDIPEGRVGNLVTTIGGPIPFRGEGPSMSYRDMLDLIYPPDLNLMPGKGK